MKTDFGSSGVKWRLILAPQVPNEDWFWLLRSQMEIDLGSSGAKWLLRSQMDTEILAQQDVRVCAKHLRKTSAIIAHLTL